MKEAKLLYLFCGLQVGIRKFRAVVGLDYLSAECTAKLNQIAYHINLTLIHIIGNYQVWGMCC